MKYDFTSIMDRHGKDAIAIDGLGTAPGFTPDAPKEGFDAIPMWVADMNFPTVPTIPEAIIERAKHPAFGYFSPTDAYFDSIIRWQERRNGVTGLTKECIGYENGVLGGVVSALNVICSKGDNVLLHSPTYIGFTGALNNNGYHIVHSPLRKDEQNIWRMDFEDMEKKIAEQHIHAAIFCSPHNPAGRVWEKWEIEKAMELFQRYDVYVISDEIWSDLILEGHRHIPTQSGQRGREKPHRRPLRPLQDLQSGGPCRQLPHHLQPLAEGSDRQGILPAPLQRYERALHARPDRRLQARGI